MNYKAFKILSIFVAILFVFSCSLTVLGYITNKNKNNLPPKPIETENGTIVERNIKYKYYLENEEVDSIPTNPKPDENSTTEDQLVYRFDQYNCTEGVTGNFNNEEWKFIPSKDVEATCELYFTKARYEVKLTVIKGNPDENNNYFVDRYKDGEFKINPNDGYEFSESQCSNDKIASYDKSKNILKISAVNSDITCKVTFIPRKLTFSLEVKNGKCDSCVQGKLTSTVNYGDSISYIIYPQDKYEFVKGKDTIKCNNNQEADYSSNNFSIGSLTANNTKCSLVFTKATIKKYKISITNSEDPIVKEKFTISQGSDEILVEEGGTGELGITVLEGVDNIPKLNCPTRIPERSQSAGNKDEYKFVWMNVTQDIKCTIDKDGEPKPIE